MKSIKIIALIFFLSGNCFSQGTEFGLMGGINLSDLGTLPATYTSNSTSGYHVGGYLNIYLGRKFDLQPQFLYSNLGCVLTQSGPYQIPNTNIVGNLTTVWNITLSYIQVPIVFVHKFGIGWNYHFGPYFGFLMTDKEHIDQTFTYGNQSQSGSQDTSSTSGDYKVDVGLTFGIGYQMQSGLGFSLGYSFGLTNTFEAQSYTDPNSGQVYSSPAFGTNSWYSFSISYLLTR